MPSCTYLHFLCLPLPRNGTICSQWVLDPISPFSPVPLELKVRYKAELVGGACIGDICKLGWKNLKRRKRSQEPKMRDVYSVCIPLPRTWQICFGSSSHTRFSAFNGLCFNRRSLPSPLPFFVSSLSPTFLSCPRIVTFTTFWMCKSSLFLVPALQAPFYQPP